jgi:hypothetical protein
MDAKGITMMGGGSLAVVPASAGRGVD